MSMTTTERITLPDLDDDEDRLLNRLLDDLAKRRVRNALRVSYYEGKHLVRQLTPVMPALYYRLGIVLGWSAKAVDILARRCTLETFVWPDGDIEELGLAEVWEDNFFQAESNAAIISSLIHGPSFLVNTAGAAEDGEPDSLIHVKDALSATGDWNSRRRRMDNLLSVTDWDPKNPGRPTGLALYLDGETITGVLEDGKWETERTEHPWGVPAEMLPYKPRTGRPFGQSRISRPVMALQDQAARTMVRLEGQSDVFGFPELWMLGADESVLKNEDGTPKNPWQAALGRIRGIPDDDDAQNPRATIQSVQAPSPEPHLATLKQFAQLFSGETSIPLTSLGVSDMSNPSSADSYIASREDLIAEAEGATDDWSPGFRRAMMRALAIKNGLDEIPEDWRTIDTKWRSPVHLSRAAEADAGSKQIAAAPWLAETSIGLELLGLDERQIKQAMADRRRAAVGVLADRVANTPPPQPPAAPQPASAPEAPAAAPLATEPAPA